MKFQFEKPQLQEVGIRVKSFGELVDFYHAIPGFYLVSQENNLGFFSSDKRQVPFLVVEGIPTGEFEKGPKKLKGLIIEVQGKENLLRLKEHFTKLNLLLGEEKRNHALVSFSAKDLEDNVLVFRLREKVQKATFCYQLAQLNLQLFEANKTKDFFETILGLRLKKDQPYYPLNKKQGFFVQQQVIEKETLAHELGLDYIHLQVASKKNLQDFVSYLEKIGMPYYRDGKLSLVTVYDNNEVEWWFSRPKIKKGEGSK